jgi:hypothetical protein
MRKPPLQDVIVMRHTDRPTHIDGDTEGLRQVPLRRDAPSIAHEQYARPARPSYEVSPPPVHHASVRNTPYDSAPDTRPPTREARVDKTWTLLALLVGAVVVATAVILSVLFAGADVTVYPKQDTVVANTSFTAQENGDAGALPFQRMVIERTAVEDVTAQAEQEVEERAQGVITIYNEYSDAKQRLIKSTRFEAEDGKIYRIRESVEVPGTRPDGTPGSVEATVYAEEPGESYNRGPSTFSVPGFAGAPQEGKVYAKSTADIAGGFAGVRRTVDEADRLKAMQSLESKLRDELLADIAASNDKPAGYRSFRDAVFFEFNALPDEHADGDQVRVSLSGKLHALLFEESTLASRLAQLTIGSYEGSRIRVDNMDELSVRVAPVRVDESAPAQTPWTSTSYTVSVSGKTVFIWEFDTEAFGRDLAGKDKAVLEAPATDGILGAYPGIDRAHATVRPFWKSTFPEDPKDIEVTVKLDE